MGLLMNFIRNGYLLGILLLLILAEKPCLSGANSVAIAAAGNSHALEQLQVQLDDMVAASASGNVHQLAACRINSKELLATAESTARGVLQGVCNPRQYFYFPFWFFDVTVRSCLAAYHTDHEE